MGKRKRGGQRVRPAGDIALGGGGEVVVQLVAAAVTETTAGRQLSAAAGAEANGRRYRRHTHGRRRHVRRMEYGGFRSGRLVGAFTGRRCHGGIAGRGVIYGNRGLGRFIGRGVGGRLCIRSGVGLPRLQAQDNEEGEQGGENVTEGKKAPEAAALLLSEMTGQHGKGSKKEDCYQHDQQTMPDHLAGCGVAGGTIRCGIGGAGGNGRL